MINISEKEYKELLKSQRKLQALEAGGVDNWEWYSESLSEFFKEEEFEEVIKDTIQEIQETLAEHHEVDYPAGREAGASVYFNEDGEVELEKVLKNLYKKFKELQDDL